jgi:predicted small lipoprotein YifL
MHPGLQIDRGEFLRLTALLALASCGRSGPEPVAVVVPAEVVDAGASPSPSTAPPLAAAPPASASSVEPAPDQHEAGDPEVDASCSNTTGTLAACGRIGPACEGMASECRSLSTDLRPRVAAAFADCFAKTRRPKCRDKALGACMRAAVESACIEPGSVTLCKSIMRSCKAAKQEPKYTLAQCAKVVSAVTTGSGPGGWDKVDEQRLGPSSEGGACSLRWVLPYQPWGPSWD